MKTSLLLFVTLVVVVGALQAANAKRLTKADRQLLRDANWSRKVNVGSSDKSTIDGTKVAEENTDNTNEDADSSDGDTNNSFGKLGHSGPSADTHHGYDVENRPECPKKVSQTSNPCP
ncbi:hypothetical protein CsSME_00012324 [Camellia sinensis var. sinensis]